MISMRMKKLLSVLLVVAMLASMAVTAFADVNPVSGLSENDIVVATADDKVSVVSITEFTDENSDGTWESTLTLSNSDSTTAQGVKITGAVTGGTNSAAIAITSENVTVSGDNTNGFTFEVTNGTNAVLKIAVSNLPANETAQDVTYTVALTGVNTSNSDGEIAIANKTITVAGKQEATKTTAVTAVAAAASGYTATLDSTTIKFAADDFAKDGTVGVKITFDANVTDDDAGCKYQIDSGKEATATLAGKVLTVSGIEVGESKTAKTLKVTPTGCNPVTLTLNFDGINFVTTEPEEDKVAVSWSNFDTNNESTLTLTNGYAAPQTIKIVPKAIANAQDATVTVTGASGDAENGYTVEVTKGTPVTLKVAVANLPAAGEQDANYTVGLTVTNTTTPAEVITVADKTIKVTGTGSGEGGGDNPGTGDSGSSGSGSSSSDSSSGSSSAAAPSANVDSKGAVSAVRVNSDAKKAVSNAKNGTANVNVTNAKTVDSAALNAMAKTAAKEDVDLTMTAKTTDRNGSVVATLKFDTAEAAKAVAAAENKEVKLGVELNTKNTKNVTSLFKKWFKNKNIVTVKMAQKGEFGFNVAAAVKVDLKKFNKDTLHFYTYNAATNSYKEINTKYTIDAKGLVHFNTTVGNYIIITDAPIASK